MLITFEGTEGSGKSTQAKKLCEYLQGINIECVLTKEPGGTEIGQKCREMLLNTKNKNLNPQAEMLLFFVDRAQHIQDVIQPGLDEGKVVIVDRYYDSTMAYQHFARGQSLDMISSLVEFTNSPTPDLTFYIDVPVEAGLNSANFRNASKGIGKTEGRFDTEKLSFHKKVKSGYEYIFNYHKHRNIEKINGCQSIDGVFNDIVATVAPIFQGYEIENEKTMRPQV